LKKILFILLSFWLIFGLPALSQDDLSSGAETESTEDEKEDCRESRRERREREREERRKRKEEEERKEKERQKRIEAERQRRIRASIEREKKERTHLLYSSDIPDPVLRLQHASSD
jgi:hypothetical protein